MADAKVARCLYERAVGYRHTVKRTLLYRGEVRTITDTVHHPPDPRACIFWLRNRRPQTWGDRADDSGGDDFRLLATLDAASRRLLSLGAGR